MTKEIEYLGYKVKNGDKTIFTVDKIHGKKYHLYEWIEPNMHNSLAVFKDEESVKKFQQILNKTE